MKFVPVMSDLAVKALNAKEAEIEIRRIKARGGSHWINLFNSYTLYLVRKDMHYKEAIGSASMVLVDGVPIRWLLKLSGLVASPSVCRGPELFENVLHGKGLSDMRHFLVGGDVSSLENLTSLWEKSNCASQKGGLAGSYSPPFTDDLEFLRNLILDEVVGSSPDVVWLGLGTPKQDYIAKSLVQDSTDLLVIAVGAAFDFNSGAKMVAPRILQQSGFEWMYRLYCEPRRLARRYLKSAQAIATSLLEVAVSRWAR